MTETDSQMELYLRVLFQICLLINDDDVVHFWRVLGHGNAWGHGKSARIREAFNNKKRAKLRTLSEPRLTPRPPPETSDALYDKKIKNKKH